MNSRHLRAISVNHFSESTKHIESDTLRDTIGGEHADGRDKTHHTGDAVSIRDKYGSQFSCPKYQPKTGKKACTHYGDGKSCALLDNASKSGAITDTTCLEVHRKRGNVALAQRARLVLDGNTPPKKAEPGKEGATRRKSKALAQPEPRSRQKNGDNDEIGLLVSVSDGDLATLEASDWTATLKTEGLGDVVIASRPELLPEDGETNAMTIRQAVILAGVAAAFPGAKVTALDMRKKTGLTGEINHLCDCGANVIAYEDAIQCINGHFGHCSVCEKPQIHTPSGLTCVDGAHGGADTKWVGPGLHG